MKKRFVLTLISLAAILAFVLAWFTAATTIDSATKERLIQPQTFVIYWMQQLSRLCPKDLANFEYPASPIGYSYLQIATKNNANPWLDLRLPEAMSWELPPFKEIPDTLAFKKFHPEKSNSDIFDIYSPFYLDHSPNCEALQKADGTAVRAADLKGPDGYVRVGYSAELINLQITVQTLQIAGITLLALLLYSFAVLLIARRLFPNPTKSITETQPLQPQSVHLAPGSRSDAANTGKETRPESAILSAQASNNKNPVEPSRENINDLSMREAVSVDVPSAQTQPSETLAPALAHAAEKSAPTGLTLDDLSKQAQLDGQPLALTPKEFDILKLLASQPGRVFSNEEILKNVWPEGSFASSQDVKQYVYFLRRKIERDPQNPQRLVTVRGFGYKLNS